MGKKIRQNKGVEPVQKRMQREIFHGKSREAEALVSKRWVKVEKKIHRNDGGKVTKLEADEKKNVDWLQNKRQKGRDYNQTNLENRSINANN